MIGPVLGRQEVGCSIPPIDSVTVPETGWMVFDGKAWPDAPQLTVRHGHLTESGNIAVTSHVMVPFIQSNCMGVYSLETDIYPGKRSWGITTDNMNTRTSDPTYKIISNIHL